MPAIHHHSALWSDPRVKPPYGSVEIDRGHAFTTGAQVGFVWLGDFGVELSLSQVGVPITSFSGTLVPSAAVGLERTMLFNGDTAHVQVAGYQFPGRSTTWIGTTILAGVQIVTLSNIDQPFFTTSKSGTGGIIFRAVNGTGVLTLILRQNITITSTLALTVGVPYVIGVSMNGISSGACTFVTRNLRTGVVSIDTAQTGGIINAGDGTYEIAGSDQFTSVNGHMGFVVHGPGVLAPSQLVEACQDPYAFLRPIIRRRYFVPPAAAAAASAVRRRLTLLGVGS
jgi:hypothetical protein